MGRKDKQYSKSLHQQMYDRLVSMQAFGTSKRDSRLTGDDKEKIFSFATYQSYKKHCQYFIDWIHEQYPQVTTLKQARAHYTEWLESRCNLSAYTVHLETAALNKLFGIAKDDEGRFIPPPRKRSDIKRSRGPVKRDSHFSATNNAELVHFCQATGLRREGVSKVRGKDLVTVDSIRALADSILRVPEAQRDSAQTKVLSICQDALLFPDIKYYIRISEKGGRHRLAPVIGKYADEVVQRFKHTAPEDKVWLYVSSDADIHGYRADYVKHIYRTYERPTECIPYDKVNKGTGHRYQSEVYICRGDERGKKLDKHAMLLASKAAGHTRIEVVARNYLWGL